MTHIRASIKADLPEITAIYAHHVLHGTGTFEIDPPDLADMTSRRADVLLKGLPYLVAADSVSGRVLGYAYCTWFKPRPAYRFSAEDSVYIVADVHGKGLGRALLAELEAQAESAATKYGRPFDKTSARREVMSARVGGSISNVPVPWSTWCA